MRVDAHSFASPAGIPSLQPVGTGLLKLPPVGRAGLLFVRQNTVDLNEALGLIPSLPGSPATPAAETCHESVLVGGTPVMGVGEMQRYDDVGLCSSWR